MNINSAFPSKYLKAEDLEGRRVPVTIDSVKMEEIGPKKEPRAVVYFAGKERGLVLNKTNAKKIVDLTGSPETSEWKGYGLTLFAIKTEFQGDVVDAIRVDGPAKTSGKSPAPEFNDDDIPF